MQQNIGTYDRLLRLTGGIILIIAAIYLKSATMSIIGIFTLYEAFSGWCIFYQLIGKDTCSLKQKAKLNLLNKFLTGLVILATAVLLNLLAKYVNLFTWYDLLQNYDQVIKNLNVDNILFLLVIYPFCLGFSAFLLKNK